MRVIVQVYVPSLGVIECKALIDTGAEVCLCRKGLFPPGFSTEAENPVKLVGANCQKMFGGDRVISVELDFSGRVPGCCEEKVLTIPTVLYEAEMREDIILSYGWLADQLFDVYPRKHGLGTRVDGVMCWIPGERTQATRSQVPKLVREPESGNGVRIESYSTSGVPS